MTITPAARRELIRAAVYHHGDLQAGRAISEQLVGLGLAGRLTPRSRSYRLTHAGMDLADRLAREDVEAATRRRAEAGLHYERPPRETLF